MKNWKRNVSYALVLFLMLGATSLAAAGKSSPASKPKPLHLDVFVADEKSFGVTSTLIYGESELLLVDAQFKKSFAVQLADRVAATHRRLKAIFITHPDDDHYTGLAVLLERFPGTPVYMTQPALQVFNQTMPQYLAAMKARAPAETPESIPTPSLLPSTHLEVDGQAVEVVPDLQGDVLQRSNSFLWIPSLRAVVAGDIVFNGVHVWLADSSPQTRSAWRDSLRRVQELHPAIVIAGHKGSADLPDSPDAAGFTGEYIAAFDHARGKAANADQLVAAMKEKYPHLGIEYILVRAAKAAYPAGI